MSAARGAEHVLLPYIGKLISTKLAARTTRLFIGNKASVVLCLGLLIQACSSIAPPAVENSVWSQHRQQLDDLAEWQLRGRVNVRYDNESHTPRIQWQQQDRSYNIRLWGTFNAGNTRIEGRPGRVTLEQGGDVLSARTPEDLILQQLGYELPVSYLEYWIKGLPAPDSRADLTFNDLNQLTALDQDGWTVSYSDPRLYGDIALPRTVVVTRPRNDVRLRFVGLTWTLTTDPESL